MDCSKVGKLLYALRKEKSMTQKQLADAMNISDKTISKWERGLGCPDVSLLSELAALLETNIEEILTGNINPNDSVGGNMKKLKFYVCKNCGNIITSTAEATISCCGRKIEAQAPKKADEEHNLNLESIDDEWFASINHEMKKEHYISFTALATGDKVLISKHYPEWDLQSYFAKMGHGFLYWYCTQHGLYYKLI